MADGRLSRWPEWYRPELDGIRAIAIGAVVVFHFNGDLPGGYLGVSLFFVLSGYLITGLLAEEHHRTGAIDVKAFYVRRARRLLPALIVFLAVTLAVVLALRHDVVNNVRGSVSALVYLNNVAAFLTGGDVGIYGHLWSLSVEEQYYLVWPVLASWVLRRWGRRGLRLVALLVTVVAVLTTATMYAIGVEWSALYTGTFNHGASLLALGSTLALVPISRFRGPLGLLGLLGVGAAFVHVTSPTPALYTSGFMLIGVPSVMLIGGASTSALLRRALSARPLVAIGVRSYGVYLWHNPLQAAVRSTLPSASGVVESMVALVLTAVVVELSYRFIERPFREPPGTARRASVLTA